MSLAKGQDWNTDTKISSSLMSPLDFDLLTSNNSLIDKTAQILSHYFYNIAAKLVFNNVMTVKG